MTNHKRILIAIGVATLFFATASIAVELWSNASYYLGEGTPGPVYVNGAIAAWFLVLGGAAMIIECLHHRSGFVGPLFLGADIILFLIDRINKVFYIPLYPLYEVFQHGSTFWAFIIVLAGSAAASFAELRNSRRSKGESLRALNIFSALLFVFSLLLTYDCCVGHGGFPLFVITGPLFLVLLALWIFLVFPRKAGIGEPGDPGQTTS